MSISLSSDQLEFKLRNATHYSLGQAAASNKGFRKIVPEHRIGAWPAPREQKGLFGATAAQRRSTASPPGTGTTCGSA